MGIRTLKPAWNRMAGLLMAILLGFSCSGLSNRSGAADTPQQVRIKGRLYLAGSEFHTFVAITDSLGRSFILLGADSLRNYQDRIALIDGILIRPKSDSIRVRRVTVLK